MSFAPFTEAERLIFVYHNGTREVRADPLVIRRKLLQASGGEFYELLTRAHEPDEVEPAQVAMDRQDCQEKVIACVRSVFGMAEVDPLTGTGCTEAMCWKVLSEYVELLEGNAPRGESSPTSSAATDSPLASS